MDDVELIFEGWLWKLTEGKRKRLLGSPWKRQYVLLKRAELEVTLEFYDKKPRHVDEKSKDSLLLNGPYLVEKRFDFKGKPFVCDVITSTTRVSLSPDDEKTLHLLAFFIQTNTKLHMKLAAECYVVRPEGTEDQRKVGARGSMCLLHVSPWGLTLALQLSNAVLGQWPLAYIKCYESSEQGQFMFEAGKRSAMGAGRYVFCTRRGQDNEIYDRLDHYVMTASSRVQSQPRGDGDFSIAHQMEQLQSLTWVYPDPAFSTHLKKVSREIYDQLWQQLDSNRSVVSVSPESFAESPQTGTNRRPRLERQPSVETLPSTLKKKSQNENRGSGHGSPSYINDPNNTLGSRKISAAVNIKDSPDGAVSRRHRTTSKNSNSTISMDSQYLHVASPMTPSSPTSINSVLSAFASPVKKAPEFRPLPEQPENLQFVSEEEAYLEPTGRVVHRETERSRRTHRARIRSQSCEDLSEYMRMSMAIAKQPHVSNIYSNEDLISEELVSLRESDVFFPAFTSTSETDLASYDLPKSPTTKTREARERGEQPQFSDMKTYFSLKSKKITRSSSNPTMVQFGVEHQNNEPVGQAAVKPASRFTQHTSGVNKPNRPAQLNVFPEITKNNTTTQEQNNNTDHYLSPVHAETTLHSTSPVTNDITISATQSTSPVTNDITVSKKTKRFKKQKSPPGEKSSQSREQLTMTASTQLGEEENPRTTPHKMKLARNGSATSGDRKLSETLC